MCSLIFLWKFFSELFDELKIQNNSIYSKYTYFISVQDKSLLSLLINLMCIYWIKLFLKINLPQTFEH